MAIHFEPILRSHGWIYLAPLDRTDRGFNYPFLLKCRIPVTLQISASSKGIAIKTDRRMGNRQMEVIRHVADHMLSLDFPLDDFQALCRQKKAMTLLRLVKKGWGRMLRSPTFWEDAVKTLCTTNASWGYTVKMCKNLCDKLGEVTPSGLKTFPLPESILKVDQRFLKEKIGMG